MGIAKKIIQDSVREMSLELNRHIVEEIKAIKLKLAELDPNSQESYKLNQERKMLNQERIEALGMYLIQGGKE